MISLVWFLERAAEVSVQDGPLTSDGRVVDMGRAETGRVVCEDALDVLVLHAGEAVAGEADTIAWAAMVDEVCQVLGCDTESQRFAAALLALAAIRLAKER